MRRSLLVLLLLLPAAYGLTGVTLTRPGELAVVRRFGRVLEHKPGPGLWVGLPWGMDRVDRVVVDRLQSVVVGYRGDDNPDLVIPPGQLLTGDHNLVNVQATRISQKLRVRTARLSSMPKMGTGPDPAVAPASFARVTTTPKTPSGKRFNSWGFERVTH